MSENTLIIESNGQITDKKKGPSKPLIYVLSIIIIIAACVGVFLGQKACSAENHKPYATGEEYTISGYVVQADKETRRTGTDRTKKHTVYKVEIEMTTPLPNGDKTFKSSDFEDYSKVDQFHNMPNTLVDFTISPEGYITKAEKSPEDKGTDIDWNDPDAIEDFENLNEEEQHDKLFNMWKEQNDK